MEALGVVPVNGSSVCHCGCTKGVGNICCACVQDVVLDVLEDALELWFSCGMVRAGGGFRKDGNGGRKTVSESSGSEGGGRVGRSSDIEPVTVPVGVYVILVPGAAITRS